MSFSKYCRLGLIATSTTLFSHYAFAHSPEYSYTFTNSINSNYDSVSRCEKGENDTLKNCVILTTSMSLNNPIAVSANNQNLYIANYGHPEFGRTSYVLKCELPTAANTNIECQGLFGIVSDAHLTGLKVTDNKFYFVHSFSYKQPDSTKRHNVNYFVSCDFVPGVRVPQCGPIIMIPDHRESPQENFNREMKIDLTEENIFIDDPVGKRVFKCTLPNTENVVTCESIPKA